MTAGSLTEAAQMLRTSQPTVSRELAGEIERALAAGFDPKTDPDAIVFTADLIDDATLARVHELQIPVNAGSVDRRRSDPQ